MQTTQQLDGHSAISSLAETTILYQVPPGLILHAWPLVRPLIVRALDSGEGSFHEADVAMACMTGAWQMWTAQAPKDDAPVAIAVTEIVTFPHLKKLVIRYVAGELNLIQHHGTAVMAFGRQNGCTMIELYGRRGWSKVLPDEWTERYVIMQKEL